VVVVNKTNRKIYIWANYKC